MKPAELQKLVEAGIISDEQREKIAEFFGLDKRRHTFLSIILGIGGVLALVGIILLIAANWDAIPRLIKIASAALIMATAHAIGWRFRGTRQTQPNLGEAFHFIGAGMFLSNIALIGQAYNLSSRTPNAILFWLIGILPLAWLLRAKSIHALSIVGLVVWLGTEINCDDGWLHFAHEQTQLAIYAALGLLLYGTASRIDNKRFPQFGVINERFGLILFHLSLWPMMVIGSWNQVSDNRLVFAVVALLAVPGLLMAYYRVRKNNESSKWLRAWPAVLLLWIACLCTWHLFHDGDSRSFNYQRTFDIVQVFAAVVMVAGCIVQIRVGIETRAMWLVNLALASIGFTIITEFVILFGSMLDTGLIFLVGGAGLLGLGYVLDRKRRSVMRQIKI
ncbi:MAG: hypothetical protein JWO95_2242 [Verrucomicrobiales bacterium]|nr:hypothetical protein [Verrucomicrobiales bacterium]